MKIEAGKCYRTREGEKVGPMKRYDDGWEGEGLNARPGYYLWKDDGSRYFDSAEKHVLAAEWIDPRAEPTRTFDPAWPHGHVTRDGRRARIVCTDANTILPCPIVALVTAKTGKEHVEFYRRDGRHPSPCPSLDLINAPAPKRELWVNVYADGKTYVSGSRHTADALVCEGRIACVRVTEGDGL